MKGITRHRAAEVIEDALADVATPCGRGLALGVCGTFYLCGLISEKDWRSYLERIPREPFDTLPFPDGSLAGGPVGAEAPPRH